MKMQLKMVSKEIFYLLYSKTIMTVFLVLLVVMIFNSVATINTFKRACNSFEKTKQYYLENGENYEAALKQDLNVDKQPTSDGFVVNVDNPIRYEYENVRGIYASLYPSRFSVSLLEMLTFLINPFLFGIFGILLVTYDYKNRTIKVKATQQNWPRYVLAKQMTNVICIVLFTVILLLLARVISEADFFYVRKTTANLGQYNFQDLIGNRYPLGAFVLKLAASTFAGVIFSTIGMTLGIFMKQSVGPIILLIIYNVFIPNLGKYDLKNMISAVGHRFFDFDGRLFQLFEPVPIEVKTAVLILAVGVLMLSLLSLVVAGKQSKYIV